MDLAVEQTKRPETEDHPSPNPHSSTSEAPTSLKRLWKRLPPSKTDKKPAKKKKKRTEEEEEVRVELPSLEVKPFSDHYRLVFFTTVELFNKKVCDGFT